MLHVIRAGYSVRGIGVDGMPFCHSEFFVQRLAKNKAPSPATIFWMLGLIQSIRNNPQEGRSIPLDNILGGRDIACRKN